MMRSKDEYQRTVAGVWSDLQNLPSRWEQYGAADTEPTESPIWVTARSARNTEDGSGVVPRRSIDLPQFADRAAGASLSVVSRPDTGCRIRQLERQ
jgi:hypothetical protein